MAAVIVIALIAGCSILVCQYRQNDRIAVKTFRHIYDEDKQQAIADVRRLYTELIIKEILK